MTPVNTVHTTHYLGAPKDWNPAKGGHIVELPAHVGAFDAQAFTFTTYWAPSAHELEVLAGGGQVCLQLIGTAHPPVVLAVAPQQPAKILNG